MELGLYVPQVAFGFDDLLHRARRCEEAGIRSLWLYDHLYAPGLPSAPSFEGWTLATALLARTERLRVGHLVLCNGFRHPVVLGRMIATLDAISGGRLDVGLGSGSVAEEHHQAGLPWGTAAERSDRLRETLEVLGPMLRGEAVLGLPPLLPVPDPPPPIVIGGAGERYTLPLVARHADVWNVPTYALGELDRKLDALRAACDAAGRDPAGIRLSVEAVLALAPDDAALPGVRALAERRFGAPGYGLDAGGLVGTPAQVVDRLGELRALGFDHVVVLTHDRAGDETIDLLATEVLPHLD